jgi:hypothetical protein
MVPYFELISCLELFPSYHFRANLATMLH